ncbi:unnamed protein product [Closterium sp. NIES-65]|nr:unnamed protein product [Closterium sp. NIES-65]
MTSIFTEKLSTVVEPEEVLQMRVDYNGRSKEMLIRWYQPPLLVGSLNVSLDLCAALTGPSAASGSSSGGGSGSGSSSSSSSSSGDSSATDLWSPSFGQLFVGFTSAALPPPSGRLPSPVALSSWTFRFTGRGWGNGARWGEGKEGRGSKPGFRGGEEGGEMGGREGGETERVKEGEIGGGEGGEMGERKEGEMGEGKEGEIGREKVRRDTNPCKASPVLPCGMGACTTKAHLPWDLSISVPSRPHSLFLLSICLLLITLPNSRHRSLRGPSVLPCGMGMCTKAIAQWDPSLLLPHTLACSPSASFSSPYPTDTDPCKGSPVLPCGTGACTKARAPWDPSILVPSCKCPFNLPSFQPSHLSGLPSCFPGETWSAVGKCPLKLPSFQPSHLAGLPSCFPGEPWTEVDSFTCRQFPRNPCAPGVCIDDVDGTYSCLCPSPYFPFYLYPKGAARCYHLRLAETRMPTFLSPYGLTCPLILNTYGLTQKDFFSQNKGDTCDSLNALFSSQILPLNPALTCSDGPRPGQLLCVSLNQTWLEEGMTRISCKLQAQITPAMTPTPPSTSPSPQPPPPPPPVANYTSLGVPVTVLQGPQTCQQLWRAFAIASPTRFFQMNPGLSCDSLLPHSPLQGNMMRRTLVEDREASKASVRQLEDDLARERVAREDKEMEVHALSARLALAEEALAQRKEAMRKVWEAIPEAVRHLPSEEDMQIISLHPETTEITLNDPSHLTLFGFLRLSCMRSLKSISVIGNLEKPALLHLYSMTWLEELRLESQSGEGEPGADGVESKQERGNQGWMGWKASRRGGTRGGWGGKQAGEREPGADGVESKQERGNQGRMGWKASRREGTRGGWGGKQAGEGEPGADGVESKQERGNQGRMGWKASRRGGTRGGWGGKQAGEGNAPARLAC